MWYFLVHWDGGAVTGYISPGHFTKEEAFKDIKNRIIRAIQVLKLKLSGATDPSTQSIFERDLTRQKKFLKSFQYPWRVTKKGYPLIEVQRLDFSMESNYWLTEIITQQSSCNVLPKESLTLTQS